MPRKATGNVYFSDGRWYARVTVEGGQRRSFALLHGITEPTARARLDVLAGIAAELRAAGRAEFAPDILERAAAAKDDRALAVVRRGVEILIERGVHSAEAASGVTFKTFAERWTSGELARLHPDHVKQKRSASDDHYRLASYVYPVVGDVPLPVFTLDHAEAVMRSLPRSLSAASRRHVAQLVNRVLSLAVFPARLIAANPLPRGFLPKLGAGKAKG